MKELIMTNHEYEQYEKWKEKEEKFSKMKENGELFYIDLPPIQANRDVCVTCPNNKPGQFNMCHCTLPHMNTIT
jgi:hypothetical protein